MADRKPWEEFSNTTSSDAPAEQKPWEAFGGETKPEPKGFLGHARDLGLSAVKSAIAVPETLVGLADIPTGGRVGKFLENEGGAVGFRPKQAKEFVSEFHTDQYKDQQRQFQDADGILDKTAVAIQNPSLIANTVVESAAPMLAGGVAARELLAGTRLGQAGAIAAERGATAAQQAQAAGRAAAAAGAIGEGTMMAGAQAEAIRQEADDGLLTAGQSGAAVATGLAGTLFGYLGGRVAQRFDLGDVDTMLARGANPQQVASEIAALPAKSIPRQVVEGAISEGFLEELPQSISEQIIQNLALGKDWSEGVEDAAVMGTLAGMAMGGGASLYSGMTRPRSAQGEQTGPEAGTVPPTGPQGFTPTAERPVIDEAALGRAGVYPPAPAPIINDRALAPAATPSQRMGLDPAAGPMSAAAALAVDGGAAAQPVADGMADPRRTDVPRERDFVPPPSGSFSSMNEFADLLGQERQDVSGRRDRIAQIQQQRREFEFEEADRRVAEQMQREATARRRMVLDAVLEDPETANPADRFAATLQRFGFRDAAPTEDELATIRRFQDVRAAQPAAPEVEPAAPNELDAAALGIRARRTAPAPQNPNGSRQAAPQEKTPTILAVKPPAATEANAPAAAPAVSGEGWDGMTAEQRAAVLTKPGGWSTAKGKLNVIGKKIARDPWAKINPTTKATIERLMQGAQTPNVPQAEQVAPQATEAGGQEGAQESRDQLIERYKKVELFSDEEYALSDRLSEMTRAEVNAKVERGEMPVFDTGRDTFTTISPSAQQPGKFQVTRYNKRGVFGDTQYDTIEAAIRDNRFNGARMLNDEEASARFAESMEAEAEYQRRRTEGQSVIDQATRRSAPAESAAPQAPQPTQAPTAPEQSSPAPGQRSEPAQPIQQPQAVQQDTQADAPEFTTLKDRDGKTVTVRTADLSGSRERMPMFTMDGKRKTTWIHRDNLDPTGEKQAESVKEIAGNPLFNVITTKDGGAFAIKAAASREINARGLAETHEVVPAGDVQAGLKGYLVRKKAEAPAASSFPEQAGAEGGDEEAMQVRRYQQKTDQWNSRVKKFGLQKIIEEARSAVAGHVLGREFGEAVEDFYKRDAAARATRDWLAANEVAPSRATTKDERKPAEQQQPGATTPAWRTVKSAPFADQASAVLALMNAAQKPSQSEEVEKAARALARSAEESGDATARGIATFIADNALEALASHKINAGRGSVVEKARHKKLKDGIERLRILEVERMTRGDEKPATAAPQATHKDPGQPAEPAQQQEKAADTQAAAERTEYPFGEVPTNQESKFFRSRVRVLPEMRGDTAWDGEVGSILNGGRLLEVTRDGRDFSVRVRGERIEVLERVENGIKESEVKFDASVNDRWSSIVAATNEESGAQRSVQALARFAGATGEPVNDVWGRWRDFIGATELAGRTGEQVVRWMESNLISEPWDDRAIPGNDVNGSMGSTPDYWRSKLADYERAMTAFNEADARMDQQTFDVERVDGSPERTKAAREILSGMRKKAAENGEYIRKKVQEAEKNEAEETARAEEDSLSRFKPFDAGLASKKPSVASITGWFAGTWSNGANTAWSDGSIADLYGEPHLKGWETRKANKRTTPDVDRVIPRNSNDPLEPVGMYDSKVGQTKGVMYYQMGDSVLPFALHYVQYFMSKYKGAKLVGNLNTPSGPAAVVHEGRTVGVIMPMRVNQVTAEELRENIAKGEKITQQREKADPTAQERTEQPAAEATAHPPAANQPALTGPRRNPTQVSAFAPYAAGDIVALDGQDWQVQQDMGGWYLTSTGNWRGMHPTIQKIRGMNELIAEIERAATAQPATAEQGDAPAGTEATAADLLTPEQARTLMAWEDLGQRDNVKSMRLAFFESAESMAAKRGAMNYGTIESYQGGKWNIDGTTYPTLKAAKAAAEEAALVRLANDGYVAQPFAAYDAVARTYGYEVRADGAIGSEGKFPGPTIKEKGGRLRVESSKGDLLGSYPAAPESLGRFLESFWGAEKQVAQPAAEQPASDRDQFTVERVDEDQRQTLTFVRGETVKVSGKYPMETGKIDGISNARKEFRIGGAWLPFGYAYKAEYDEFAAPRRELEEMIANAEKRIADGTGFQRDGYPIRDAREHAKRYSLEGYDDTLNDLAKRGQAAFDRSLAEERARIAAAEQTDRERREAADAADAAKYAGPVKMTMDEWKRIGRDFKSFNGGKRTVMQDGRIRRVEIVKEKAEAPDAEASAGYAAQHEALMASVRTGKATPEAFKASFEQVVANEAAIKAELSAKTKAELLREGGPYLEMRYANEKKDGVVDAVYRQMIGEYALGEAVTYGMARDSYQKAVRRMVEATDADKLAQYVRDREAAIQEAEVRRTARAEAMANPQTLNDYRSLMNTHIREGKTRHEAFLMLTPEQRIRYDELEAEGTREAREARKRAAQNEVRAAGQTTGGQIIATKHTRDGHDLFVVQLAERLSREDYNTVLAGAKRLGGRYSAFRGNGAVPGFQFRTREDAEAFLKLAGGDAAAAKDQVEQRRDAFADDRSQTAAERLVEMADRMEQDASAEENRDRKANTARRARFASAALNAAAAQKATARTMRNIAQAIQEGRAKFLDAVRTRTQVDALLGYVRTAKDKELRAKYPSYADQEKRKGEPATAETAGFADFPSYTAFRSDLAMLGRQMLEIDGTKKLGQKLMSVADDVTDAYLEFARDNIRAVSQFGRGDALAEFANRESAERAIRRSGLVGKAIVLPIKRGQNRVILSPSEAMSRKVWAGDGDKRITLSGEFGKELVEAIGRRGNKTNGLAVPWQFQNAYDRRKLLSRIGIETPSEFRSALREVIALQETAVANKVREMELAMVGRRADGLDFFPTPAEIADQMVEAADIKPDMAVLEPSAGMGHIADRIREAGAEPDVIEISAERRELLEEKGYHLAEVNDFMNMEPRKFFTYGDIFRAPDGKQGILRGLGSMGSQRVRLEDEQGSLLGMYQRDEVVGVAHRGSWSGYDRIIMNPPFSDRRDAEHVQHAYTLLRPGGRIVAIMGEGVFFGQDKRAQDFRDWLDSVGGTSEKLPEGSFMDPSLPVQTGVNARMVVIDRPAVDDGVRRPGDADPEVAFSATLPRDRNAVRIGITEKGLVRAMRLQFDGLAEITGKLLERGRAGKRGGVIVVGTADNADIGRIVAERTGRKLDSTMRKFSSAGRRNGFYDPKTGLTFLVAPNLNPVTATAVMLHEMMHGQQRQKIDARALEMVRNRHGLKDEGLRAFLDRVMLRMIKAGEVGNAAEASAYIVEQAVIEGRSAGYTFADNAFMQWVDAKIGKRVGDFLRSFAGMIRTWMLRNGLGAKTMTVDDFVGYAMAGLDRAAAGAVRGRASGGRMASMSDENGTSYLVLPGVRVHPMSEQSAPGSSGMRQSRASPIQDYEQSRIEGATVSVSLTPESAAEVRIERKISAASNPADKARLQGYYDFLRGRQSAAKEKGPRLEVSYQQGWNKGKNLRENILKGRPWYETEKHRDGSAWKWEMYREGLYVASGEAKSEKLADQAIEDAKISAMESRDDFAKIRFSRSVGDAPAQEAQRVQSAIEGKTLIEAAQFLTRSKDGAKAAVAQKVLEKLQRLEKAGVVLDLKIVHRGDMAPASMVNARGYTETGFDEKGRDIVVWLNGADVTGKVGTEEEVLLHELVHAATAGMVFYGTQTPNSLAGKHARDLMAVTDAIAEHIRKRFDAADAGKETLTEFEQDMRDGANNAFRSDDEVLAWALSNSEAQAYLETIPYRSGSMWSNFVQAVRNLLGLGARNDTALSEVLRVAERILTDDAPAAGRAAFWHKRNIRMAQQQVRGSIVQTAERGADDLQFSRSGLRELASRATAELNNTLTAPGKLSWWHKTVGTMYNLAERSPAFRPVFQAAQGFIDDVSHYAADAAERAPKLLPRLDTWRDIMKSPISAEDNAAVGKPIFEGTLSWTRDADGRPVRVDALIDAASGLSIEEMAAELVSRGAIEERTLRMWRGMPDAQFESAIRTRYENSFLQPGVVWTDDELVSLFSLTPAQIELYREFRAAVDRSLDTMARADMLRFAGEDVRFLRDPVMEADTLREAASLIVMNLNEQANAKPDRAEQFMATSQGVMDRMEKVLKLQATGYAPLSRFGKYTVDVVVDGNREYFGLFESAREANKMAERMRAEFGAGTVTQGTLSDEAFRLFAGITPESLELFGNMLGLDSTGDEAQDRAFQEYLRLTKTNRSALRRLIHRKGIAGFSEDVSRVLASFAYSNARQTAAGLHMGDLSQAVSDIPKEQGELKDVAVKLSEYIKNPQEEAQAIRGLLFAQYLGGSVASAFVNMTQPAAVTFPWLSQHGGAKMAAAEIGKAAKHIATRGHRYESDLAEALKAAEEDGVVSPQEVHQLMAQARGSGSLTAGDGTRAGNARALASNSITRLSAAWGKLFSAAEQLNRRITFIAAYRVAKQKRMEDPAAFARRAVQETQFVYSKASKMQWGRGAVGGTLMTFKTYSVAYMELMSRLWSQGAPGSAERKAGRKAVALMLGMLLLMGGGGGLPFMEDAEDLIDGIAQIAGYNFSTKKARQQFLMDAFGDDAADFIERGVSGLPGVPLDVSGRLGLGNLIPGTGLFLDRSNHTRDILELLGPVGDLGGRVVSGARKAVSGDVGGALLEVSPVAVRNVAKGVDMAVMDQYRDTRGRKVLDTTDLEAALKAIGFQPASVAKVQDANYLNQRAKDFYSLSADRISATWAAGIYEKDSDKVQKARDMIAQWNEDNPDQPMMIRMPNILRRVREMGKDKAQRIADTAPRAMRQQLREELLRQ